MTILSTYECKQHYLLDPKKVDQNNGNFPSLKAIAVSLGNTCRFNGHVTEFYCVTPETKILTEDLEWVSAVNLPSTCQLLAVDENPTDSQYSAGEKKIRKSKPAEGLNYGIIQRELIRLNLSDGSYITASEEHPWLVASKVSNNQKWETCKQIATSINKGKRRYINRWMPKSWDIFPGSLTDFERGYLAAMFDGEGHLTYGTSGGASAMTLGFAQNKGPVLEKVVSLLDKLGVGYRSRKNPSSEVINITIRGRWFNRVALLKYIGSIRLWNKALKYSKTYGFFCLRSYEKLEITSTEYLGSGDVVALETSARTYFAEGFVAHNSVAQHQLLVASLVPEELKTEALFHDAHESVTGDVTTPTKDLVQGYRCFETAHAEFFRRNLNLNKVLSEEVKYADLQALKLEKSMLLPWDLTEWYVLQGVDLPDVDWPKPLQPKEAGEAYYDAIVPF